MRKYNKKYNHLRLKCNIKGGTLNAHHIKHWSSNKKEIFNTSNGITLC
jgi:hypothetical protein